MLNSNEKQKIKRFVSDVTMFKVVKDVLRESFLKDRKGDVQILASQMLAVNMLDEGFKELGKEANKLEQEDKPKEQIAL